jgi:hypothetical protein
MLDLHSALVLPALLAFSCYLSCLQVIPYANMTQAQRVAGWNPAIFRLQPGDEMYEFGQRILFPLEYAAKDDAERKIVVERMKVDRRENILARILAAGVVQRQKLVAERQEGYRREGVAIIATPKRPRTS